MLIVNSECANKYTIRYLLDAVRCYRLSILAYPLRRVAVCNEAREDGVV